MAFSEIERLPPELLQPIFLLSGPNLALPAASHLIATKLAHHYIYQEVCNQYLASTPDTFPSREDWAKAQTRIFRSKWMTWDFFKSFITKTYQDNGCLCGQTPETGCLDPQWPPDWEDATTMVFSRSHLPRLSFIKCRLPVKLLHGPWTQDKSQFLRFLLWTTSMTVDWADPDVRRITLEGKRDAMLENNLNVVELFNHNRRLGKAPGLSAVRFAVMEAGCDRSIVYDIMATARTWGLRGDSWKSPDLDKWCEDRIQQGDPKGKWLRLKLRELRASYETGNRVWNNEGSERGGLSGHMDPKSGDYEADGDRLVVHQHRWNQTVEQYGWFYRFTGGYVGLHGLRLHQLADLNPDVLMTRPRWGVLDRHINGWAISPRSRRFVKMFMLVPVSATCRTCDIRDSSQDDL